MYELNLHITEEQALFVKEFEQFRRSKIDKYQGLANAMELTRSFLKAEQTACTTTTKNNYNGTIYRHSKIGEGISKILYILKEFPTIEIEYNMLKVITENVNSDKEAEKEFLKDATNALRRIYEARELFVEYESFVNSKEIADKYVEIIEFIIELL